MLCTGSRLRCTALNIWLHFQNWTTINLPPVDVATWFPNKGDMCARRMNVFPILLTLNEASMHPVYGGYSLRLGPVDIGLSPSVSPHDATLCRLAKSSPNLHNATIFDSHSRPGRHMGDVSQNHRHMPSAGPSKACVYLQRARAQRRGRGATQAQLCDAKRWFRTVSTITQACASNRVPPCEVLPPVHFTYDTRRTDQ